MPLNDEQREKLEDTIMHLQMASSKIIDSGKDVHRKVFEVEIEEAIELITLLKDDLKDDEKLSDYKLYLLIPFQMHELLKERELND